MCTCTEQLHLLYYSKSLLKDTVPYHFTPNNDYICVLNPLTNKISAIKGSGAGVNPYVHYDTFLDQQISTKQRSIEIRRTTGC
jgi:hypothetical protein